MNSSQNRTLAITNCFNRSLLYKVITLCFFVTLQSCSTIESVFDGSIFSDTTNQPSQEIKTDDKGELDGEAPAKEGIRDLKGSNAPAVKPLNQSRRTVPSNQAKVEAVAPKSIEIMWQVPTEPVEAYHIYLLSGPMDQADEKRHFRVLVTGLKKEDDPTYGPVYKYQVPGNLTANTIQIRAENRFGLSEPSEPMVVQK